MTRERFFGFVKENRMTILLLVVLVALFVYRRAEHVEHDSPLIGKKADLFPAKSLAGNAPVFSGGQNPVTLLSFWATWCLPCRAEIPMLASLQQELGGRLRIVGISSENPDVILAFAKEHPFSYPIVADSEWLWHTRYKIEAYPTLVLIDSDGIVREITHGLDPLLIWKIRRRVTGSFF